MKPSAFDGQFVNYVDPVKIQHQGIVVGASDDSQWLYIQSTNPKVEPADWHFKVSADVIESVLSTK
jgi:hypothetical protein